MHDYTPSSEAERVAREEYDNQQRRERFYQRWAESEREAERVALELLGRQVRAAGLVA